MNSKYEAVIGLEVHAQLSTNSKIFCGCSTKFGSDPNSNVCPICLGHPGVLPVLNKKVVEYAVLMGLATNCQIRERSTFARKNYFYPDSPKGWQTSQFDEPICENGYLDVTTSDGEDHRLRINRIHMEEDAGKSIHDKGSETLVDLNRTGVPLIEIVSEPDMHSAEEAYLYLNKIKQIVQYLDICDGNMEEGSLRCDANISIRLKGDTELGTKAEVKNMNSFKNVEKAINVEIARQIEILEDGGRIVQQTLLWDADLEDVFPMRSKEESHDYRYFPEPDLMPVVVNEEWKNEIAKNLPELPEARMNRFVEEFKLPEYDAEILTSSRALADYYERAIKVTNDYKSASNWIMGDVLKIVKEEKIDIADFPISAENIGKLIELINNNTISGKIAKDVFPEMLKTNEDPSKIVKEKNLVQITDTSALEKIIDEIIANNQSQVQQYISGKETVIGFLVGQVMKVSQGKANPKAVNELLKQKLDEQK